MLLEPVLTGNRIYSIRKPRLQRLDEDRGSTTQSAHGKEEIAHLSKELRMGEGWEDSQPSNNEAADGRGGREKKAVGAQCSFNVRQKVWVGRTVNRVWFTVQQSNA
ncbi:hypothetical protein TIFTF001_024739 [Ficus carica]|uniref:Uncharacterized protein n=1 Tax=Ficus carica TaxID=3494 RepID=A0AA88AIH8_FICCA|nr:hypothetical protein TIFTF001_024739 [Ficus carica]